MAEDKILCQVFDGHLTIVPLVGVQIVLWN